VNTLAVYCADIGSVKAGHFGWARLCAGASSEFSGIRDSPGGLAAEVAKDLRLGHPVALGFECPLFVPLPEEPTALTAARPGEGDRPWSAGAGAACLATGLTETIWILERIKGALDRPSNAFLNWGEFQRAGSGLFLWEAFVTKAAKRSSHQNDAEAAVEYFDSLFPNIAESNAIQCTRVRSLIGAALLQARWSTDLRLLETPCVVLRVDSPQISNTSL